MGNIGEQKILATIYDTNVQQASSRVEIEGNFPIPKANCYETTLVSLALSVMCSTLFGETYDVTENLMSLMFAVFERKSLPQKKTSCAVP